MPSMISEIEQRRKLVLAQMSALRSMRAAALSEQMLPVPHKGHKEPVMRGPYYVLSRRVDGKTRSQRVPAEDVEQVKKEVANHKKFLALCREFEELTERLGALEREATASDEAEKKGLKSRKKSRPK